MRRAREELALGREVLLDVGVVVEVVAGEVGEERGREAHAGHPPLGQRVRGDLHRAGRVPRLEHAPEELLQLGRVRRGVERRDRDAADQGLDRADQARPVAGGLEDRPQQEGRGGLAVGAGHPDHPQPLGGPPGQRGRRERHAEAGVGHQRLRHGQVERALHQQRRRAASHRVGGEVVAVAQAAGETAEQRPGAGLVGAVHHLADARRGGAGREDAPSGDAPGELLEGHARRDATRAPGRSDQGAISSICREYSAIFSNAGAATSPP